MLPKRPRLKAFDYVGLYRYFVTFCTHDRTAILIAGDIVDMVMSEILHAARERDFAVRAYVAMPDHIHLLVEGTSEASDLKAFATLAKQKTGYAYARRRRGKLWQPSYHERVLRGDEDDLRVIWYILNNPVRAGLVDLPEAYPFLGSATYAIEDIRRALEEHPRPPWQP
jgi:putative transposase